MILKNRQFLLFIFLFFFVRSAFSQDPDNTLPLKTVLLQIEKQHDITFSYTDQDVDGINIVPPFRTVTLKQKLIDLRVRTGLNFKQVKDYVIIYASKEDNLICGYLEDESKQPVEGASINYPKTGENTLSDSNGYFEITRNASSLVISHPAYNSVSLVTESFKKGECRTIRLIMPVTVLEEVVTERYLTKGISKKNDGSVIITPGKFGILPGLIEPDVLQTMQQLPGISSVDETVSNINVRGGTHDQNLFLWNGIRLFQTGHFFGLISALNPNLPHHIKIYKNGTSAFYGESVSSAVDISSRTENVDGDKGSVGANMINADFYVVSRTSKNSGIELSARRSFTDIINLPAYSQYSKRVFQNTVVTDLNNSSDVNYKSDKEFFFYDFTAQFHQKIDKNNDLFIDFIGMKNKLNFTQGTITQTRVVTKNSSLSQLTIGGSLTWRTQWNNKNKGEAMVYSTYYNVEGANQELLNNQELAQKNRVFNNSIHLTNSTSLSDSFTLNTGYQFDEIGITNTDAINTPSYSRSVKETLHTHAFIGEAEYKPSQKIYSTLGLRANYLEKFSMFLLEPRIQFNYAINNKWKVEVLGEFKSQSASQIADVQQDFLGIEKRTWMLANEEDRPVQKSRQASVGLYYRANRWQISLENFYKKVNGITTPEQAFQNQLEFTNLTGSYSVIGTEFLIQKEFKDFYAWVSYTWNNNEYKFKDFEPSQFPSNFEIRHTIKCGATYEWNHLKLALGSKWYTGRPETMPVNNEPVQGSNGIYEVSYASPNSTNIEDFFQIDFSVMYALKLQKGTMQFGVSVMNLLDRKNIINRYYRINNDSNSIEVVNTYSVERVPNAMVRFNF